MDKISLRSARVNVGLTQKEVARILRISNSTLCNWENGITYPNAQQIDALCELYKMPYDSINFLPNNPIKTD